MKLGPFIASVSACAWLLARAPTAQPVPEHLDVPRAMTKTRGKQEKIQEEGFQLSDSTRAKQLIHFEDNESVGDFPHPTDSP